MTELTRLTLNTGDLHSSPRSGVLDRTVRLLDPLVRHKGGYIPAFQGDLELGFALLPERERCLIQIVSRHRGQKHHPAFRLTAFAWSEDAAETAWKAICEIATKAGVQPPETRPSPLPILMTLLTADAKTVTPDIMTAGSDLEACIAWTILAGEGLSA